MTLTILHTGQTGVERGACRAARATGLVTAGFCDRNRDELGALPPEVGEGLRLSTRAGARAAVYATLDEATTVIIAVPKASDASSNTAMQALRRAIRLRGIPHQVVDPTSDLDELAVRIRELHQRLGDAKILVTGPRKTRWAEGESLGWAIVSRIAMAMDVKRRVLLIDDNAAALEVLRAQVQRLGHDCVVHPDGASAVEAVLCLRPEIALVNLREAGPVVCGEALRLREAHPRLFVGALISADSAHHQAIAARFDRAYVNPLMAEDLHAFLRDAELALGTG